MYLKKDKIRDVIAVLKVLRDRSRQTRQYRNTSDLRIDAVNEVAGGELLNRRFLNEDSARKSIHDTCARRLTGNIRMFDSLVDKWLRQNSTDLRDVLLKSAEGSLQRTAVIRFFEDTTQP